MRNEATTNRFGASEDVTTSDTSAQSGACPAQHYRVRIVAQTADMRVVIGDNPTAVATSTLLLAGVTEYANVTPGQKIAAIQDSAAGKLNITWLTS